MICEMFSLKVSLPSMKTFHRSLKIFSEFVVLLIKPFNTVV